MEKKKNKWRKRYLAYVLMIMLVLMSINWVPMRVEAANYEYAMIPMAYLNVSNGESGHGGRKCIDFAGKDTGKDAFYAPFSGKVVRMYSDWNGGNHDVIIESLAPVQWSDGTIDYVCIWMAHDDDVSDMYVGKTFNQGEEIYREGNYGNASGNHVHFVCGKGKYEGLKEVSSGWTIKNEVSAYKIFYLYENTSVVNNGGYTWKTLKGSKSNFKDAGGNTSPVSFSNTKVEDVTNTSAKIVTSFTYTYYSEVGFYLGTSNDLSKMTKKSEGGGNYSSNSYKLGTLYDGVYKWSGPLSPGTTYYYAFYVVYGGKEYVSNIMSFKTTGTSPSVDKEAPKITNLKIESVNSSGYTVSCTITDNVGVTKVNFPTWTDWKDQDDLPKVWPSYTSKSGTTYYFNVKISDHNNERGKYTTHVYAYDAAGNSSSAGIGVVVPDVDKEAPKISNLKVESVNSSGYTVSCTVTDNVGVTKVCFPTWTEANGQDDLASVWPAYTSNSGNTYYFNVKISDHNNEKGNYITHVYAYDAEGNYAFAGITAKVPNIYEINYNANGGVGAPAKQSKTEGVNIYLSNAVPTYTGYSFVGWNTKADGTGTSYAAGATYTGNANLTLYAQWKKNVPAGYKKGDVNGDGMIDVKDKKLVLYHIRGINKLSGNGFNAGDVNGDGVVDVKDKKLILYHIRGINTIK